MSHSNLTIRRLGGGPFETWVGRSGDRICLTLAGELDIFGAECLIGMVRDLLASQPTETLVILDLSRVSFISLSGIRAINASCASLASSGLAVVTPSIPCAIERATIAAGLSLTVTVSSEIAASEVVPP